MVELLLCFVKFFRRFGDLLSRLVFSSRAAPFLRASTCLFYYRPLMAVSLVRSVRSGGNRAPQTGIQSQNLLAEPVASA